MSSLFGFCEFVLDSGQLSVGTKALNNARDCAQITVRCACRQQQMGQTYRLRNIAEELEGEALVGSWHRER
jgi:hypothetical protein